MTTASSEYSLVTPPSASSDDIDDLFASFSEADTAMTYADWVELFAA